MPDIVGGGFLADLTTAPIFDDDVYQIEALALSESQTEDDLDTDLALAARAAGIEDPYRYLCPDLHDVSTAMSTVTIASDHRSSMSIHSRETQSTGITSHPSRTSRDHYYLDRSPALRTPPMMRNSSSLDCYDSVMDRFRPPVHHQSSSSTVSGANSLMSAASSLPKPAPRKHKRASGLFAMFRKDSTTCRSRSHHGHHAKPSTPKLECGHVLSKFAIRMHIQEALESKEHAVPSCCGKPLPKSILEIVLTEEEAEVVSADALRSPGLSSLQDSGYSEDGMSAIDIPTSSYARPMPTESYSPAPQIPSQDLLSEDDYFGPFLTNGAYKALQTQQRDQLQRVVSFEFRQRKALDAYHQWSQKRLASQHGTRRSERVKQHPIELERLDESQIVAEHDLRKTHAQETQNVATALKYMEAYCSGNNPTNPDVVHTITDEDRRKLARQHVTQQKLPAKHESAINVLRARQEKDTKVKLQKQQAELQHIDTDFERAKRADDLQYIKDSTRLDAVINSRRRRVMHRWDLRFEMCRRDWESQQGCKLPAQLPREDWPETAEQNTSLDQSSSLALYLQAVS